MCMLALIMLEERRLMVACEQVIDDIRHSVFALRGLPPAVQLAARHVYFDAIRIAFIASTCFAAISAFSSLFANAKALERAHCPVKCEEEEVGSTV